MSLLITLPVLVASGPQAVAVVVWIVLPVSASLTSFKPFVRYRPGLFLRTQIAHRVVNCGLVYFVLVHYHALLL